jgi:hypothetical protein
LADYELFINCGGEEVTVDNKKYEEDRARTQPASYFFRSSDERWALSSTGYFVGRANTTYAAKSLPALQMTNLEQYYWTARLSPMSLKYYGLCLQQKGPYNVSLHFAEIMFADDQTFSSVGRRIFDVSIQVLLDSKMDFK